MKSKLLLLAALLAATLSTQAADTPGSNPSVPAPTVADRLANARKAIAVKDWTVAMRELNVAVRDGRIKKGDLVLLEAMGGGFTWGSALVRW